jgi:hypothetical protein
VKETLALLGAWTSQVLAFGQALRELLKDLKGVGLGRFLSLWALGVLRGGLGARLSANPSSGAP